MPINHQFPLIKYDADHTPYDWGLSHGEEFKEGIRELAEIRRTLMLEKNPELGMAKTDLDEIARTQWEVTKNFSPMLAREIEGMAKGSGCSLTDLVILNNYTDFRDITLPEEGCTTIHNQRGEETLSGQTWDMHGSAKNYLCLIQTPEFENYPSSLILSLVGCTGLMGISRRGTLIGVNNINTDNAEAGLIWPILVREVLAGKNLSQMRDILLSAPVTSGHNYIISDKHAGEHWEITPEQKERVAQTKQGETGDAYHTNHCLGEKIKPLEQKRSQSSTTYDRYDLVSQKVSAVNTLDDLYNLLTDHENYPRSICGHFSSGTQDPSTTCGGGISALSAANQETRFWRGCPTNDEDYKEYRFHVDHGKWVQDT